MESKNFRVPQPKGESIDPTMENYNRKSYPYQEEITMDWEELKELANKLMEAGLTELSSEIWEAIHTPVNDEIPDELVLVQFQKLRQQALQALNSQPLEEEEEEGKPEWETKELPYYQKGEKDFASVLGNKLSSVQSPEWYLSLIALVFNKTDDEQEAIKMADQLLQEYPNPPEDESSEAWKVVADDQAMDEYLGIGASPQPIEKEEEGQEEDFVDNDIANEDVFPEENSKGLIVPFTPFINLTKALTESDTTWVLFNQYAKVGTPYEERPSIKNLCVKPTPFSKAISTQPSTSQQVREILQRDTPLITQHAENQEWDRVESLYDQIFMELGIEGISAADIVFFLQDMDSQGVQAGRAVESENNMLLQLVQRGEEQVESIPAEAKHPLAYEEEPEEIPDEDTKVAKLEYAEGEKEQVKKVMNQNGWSTKDVVDLSGGHMEDSEVYLNYKDGKIIVGVQNPMFQITRQIIKYGDDLILYNDQFFLDKKIPTGSGLGIQIFNSQVTAARALNFRLIRCYAARVDAKKLSKEEIELGMEQERDVVGFYVWPRFGYNTRIEDIPDRAVQEEIRKRYPKAKDLLDIMVTKNGRDWWKKRGCSIAATFNLADGSKSMLTFQAYLDELKQEGKWKSMSEQTNYRDNIDISDAQEAAIERAWNRIESEGGFPANAEGVPDVTFSKTRKKSLYVKKSPFLGRKSLSISFIKAESSDNDSTSKQPGTNVERKLTNLRTEKVNVVSQFQKKDDFGEPHLHTAIIQAADEIQEGKEPITWYRWMVFNTEKNTPPITGEWTTNVEESINEIENWLGEQPIEETVQTEDKVPAQPKQQHPARNVSIPLPEDLQGVVKKSKIKNIQYFISSRERTNVQPILNEMFPNTENPITEASSCIGALDDSVIRIANAGKFSSKYVHTEQFSETKGIRLEVRHPFLKHCSRFLGIDKEGKKFVLNEFIFIKKEHRGGTGLSIFANEAGNAFTNGFSYLTCNADGNYATIDKENGLSGFYIWLGFGFNLTMEKYREQAPALADEIVSRFGVTDFLGLMSSEEGRKFWHDSGQAINGAIFELDNLESESWKTLKHKIRKLRKS